MTFSIPESIDLKAYWRKEKKLILFTIFSLFLVYGYSLFNFTLTIDEELSLFHKTANMGWVRQGRWGTYLLNRLILPHPVIPFMPEFLSVIFYGISYLVLMNLWKTKYDLAKFAALPFFVSFPTLFHTYIFDTVSYATAMGFFVSALGLLFFFKENSHKDYWAIVLFSFAIAIYQSLLFFIGVAFLLTMATLILNESDKDSQWFIKIAIKFLVWIGLSLGIYFGMNKIILWLLHESASYVGQFMSLSVLFESFSRITMKTWQALWSIFWGTDAVYLDRNYVIPILLLGGGVLVMFLGFQKIKNRKKVLIYLASIVIAITAPFALHLLNRGMMPYRSLLSLPVALSGVLYLACQNSWKWLRQAIFLVSIISLFQFSNIQNRQYLLTTLTYESDRALALEIIHRIEDMGIYPSEKAPVKIALVGKYEPPFTDPLIRVPTSTIGASFFEWGSGNSWRAVTFFKTLGRYNFQGVSKDKKQELALKAKDFPKWPSAGAVQKVGDTIVVKF